MENYKIGDVFQFGRIKLKCVEGKLYSCNGCIFEDCDENICTCIENFIGECNPSSREDKKKVMFKEVEGDK